MMSVDETLMCSFQILKQADKKKFPYGGLNAGRPVTPPRGATQQKAKKKWKWEVFRKLVENISKNQFMNVTQFYWFSSKSVVIKRTTIFSLWKTLFEENLDL